MVVDKSDERVREMFGQIAPKYDRMNHLLSMNVDRYWRWRTVHMVPPQGSDPILDVCCGTGDLALAYYRAGRGKVPVVASDFCPEMLQRATQKRDQLGPQIDMTIVEADAQNLPFDDNHFQIVSVAFGLRNIANTHVSLREMTRVCRPGGKVAILEFSMPQHAPIRAIYGWYFRNVLPRLGQWLARNDHAAYNYLPESVGEFPAGETLCQMMRDAGLSTASFHPLTLGVATLYIGNK